MVLCGNPPAEIFFQPDIEADEKIAAAHFLDLSARLLLRAHLES
jgi:hypothetical protein